jgi:hypothetical protein
MSAARQAECRRNVAGRDAPVEKRRCTFLGLALAVAFTLPAGIAWAQDSGGGGGNPIMPKFSIGGEQKRKLTPEEEERQKQLDADYKAATSKIPAQKTPDPWGDVRQAPGGAGQKASAPTQSVSAQKKKSSAQQPQ